MITLGSRLRRGPGVARMSTTLTVYVVPLDQLARVPGSGDRDLADTMGIESPAWFARIDELADPDPDPDEDDQTVPTCLEALRRIVEGVARGSVPGHHGYVYGYAIEALCGHLGEELENVASISGSSDWVDEIDRFLGEVEVPLSLTDLVFGGSPVPIPEPDDCPAIGWWSPEQIARAVGPLRNVYVGDPNDDPGWTVLQIRRWVEQAAGRPGHALVGFLS